MDDEQSKMAGTLAKKLATFGSDADQYLADISSMVVAAVFNLHREGDYLFEPQFKILKPSKRDSTMTATERMAVICDLLLDCKKNVADLMEGSDAITRFVAAPQGSADRKARYKDSNSQRAQKTKALRELRMGAEDEAKSGLDDQNEDSGRPSKGRGRGRAAAGGRKNTRTAVADET